MAARYTRRFYRDVLTSLERANVPVLVGGAFAFSHFTGIQRPTKDFDLFVRREHIERALATLADAGFHTELTFPHWLGKARSDEFLVDLIFGSGNGVAPVDDMWFENAVQAEAVGVPVWLDQPFWAQQLVRIGVSPTTLPLRRLSPDLLAGAIRDAIDRPAFSNRAQEIAESINAEDGAARVVAAVRRTLKNHSTLDTLGAA